jgi:hypothetical protein
MELISIDQNCHPLWDVPPKLHALVRAGHSVRHYIEDIDVAFTSIGAGVDDDDQAPQMRIARERFYRSGPADWGAAVFYFGFLGRQPIEIRQYEPYTGVKTNVLAGKLGCSVDDLYDRFSPGDNWQLIGPSYFRNRDLHRVIGDLSVSQTAGFLGEIIDIARRDMLDAFPDDESQRRIGAWLDTQRSMLTGLIESVGDGTLVDVYHQWLSSCAESTTTLGLTSELFACGRDAAQTELLELFTSRYEQTAEMYNAAIEETAQPLRQLDINRGELPFFATIARDGHMVRCGVSLSGGSLQIADMRFELLSGGRIPAGAMRAAGVVALAGKAMVLVIQARIGPNGRALALPHRGSLYMPAADRLASKLTQADLLPGELQPVVRVRLGFLDALKTIETPIRLPKYLQAAMGSEVIPASDLGRLWRGLIDEARQRLEIFQSPQGPDQWRRQTCSDELDQLDQLDKKRRELAQTDPKGAEIRNLSKQAKQISSHMLEVQLLQIANDLHTVELDYWDSRGAIWPWSVALGGQEFYSRLIANAEIHVETPSPGETQ